MRASSSTAPAGPSQLGGGSPPQGQMAPSGAKRRRATWEQDACNSPLQDPPHGLKILYRQTKSEIVTQLLSEVWDKSEYDFNRELIRLWRERITPLTKLEPHGLPKEVAEDDLRHLLKKLPPTP